MTRNLYTDEEIILCTYIAMYGRGWLIDRKIHKLHLRSEDSIKMKVQNIASMLFEEGYEFSSEVSKLTGKPPGEKGRRTNWKLVQKLTAFSEKELKEKCRGILNQHANKAN